MEEHFNISSTSDCPVWNPAKTLSEHIASYPKAFKTLWAAISALEYSQGNIEIEMDEQLFVVNQLLTISTVIAAAKLYDPYVYFERDTPLEEIQPYIMVLTLIYISIKKVNSVTSLEDVLLYLLTTKSYISQGDDNENDFCIIIEALTSLCNTEKATAKVFAAINLDKILQAAQNHPSQLIHKTLKAFSDKKNRGTRSASKNKKNDNKKTAAPAQTSAHIDEKKWTIIFNMLVNATPEDAKALLINQKISLTKDQEQQIVNASAKCKPVFQAIGNNDIRALEAILKKDSSQANRGHFNGNTPLFQAASNQQQAIIRMLVKYGGDMNTVSPPLFWSIRDGKTDSAHTLIDLGADVTIGIALGEKKFTFLQQAIQGWVKYGNDMNSIAKKLLNRGADVEQRPDIYAGNASGKYKNISFLHMAILQGNKDLVKILLDHVDEKYKNNPEKKQNFINAKDTKDHTPLIHAIQMGDKKSVKLLLNHHADIYAATKKGLTALHFAVIENRYKILEMLLKHAAPFSPTQIDVLSNFKETPLAFAIKNKSPEMVRLLLQAGASANLPQKFWVGQESFFYTFADIKKESDLETATNRTFGLEATNFFLPLYQGIKSGSVEIVALLLEHGADTNLGNGETALTIAKKLGKNNIVCYLLEREHKEKQFFYSETPDRQNPTQINVAVYEAPAPLQTQEKNWPKQKNYKKDPKEIKDFSLVDSYSYENKKQMPTFLGGISADQFTPIRNAPNSYIFYPQVSLLSKAKDREDRNKIMSICNKNLDKFVGEEGQGIKRLKFSLSTPPTLALKTKTGSFSGEVTAEVKTTGTKWRGFAGKFSQDATTNTSSPQKNKSACLYVMGLWGKNGLHKKADKISLNNTLDISSESIFAQNAEDKNAAKQKNNDSNKKRRQHTRRKK